MKYKSKQEPKYILFFIFHMVFQYFQRVIPIASPYRIAFKIENAIALIAVISAMCYEIYARHKFDRDSGNQYKVITKDEVVNLIIALLAVVIIIWNPFQR